MVSPFLEYFSIDNFIPQGFLYQWHAVLVWTMASTDLLIGISFLGISYCLYRLVRDIRLPFSGAFVAFGFFIFAGGFMHFMEVYTLWVPNYWLLALLKFGTAVASVATACYIFIISPEIVKVAKNARLAEVRRRELEELAIELEMRVDARTEELMKAVEVRDEFLSIASHELRTPLTPLKLQLQLGEKILIDKPGLEEEVPRLFRHVRGALRQVDKLTALVDNLLDVSRIQSGRMKMDKTFINLSDLVSDISNRYKDNFKELGIGFKYYMEDDLSGVFDRLRLEQVIDNLLSNAIKYGEGKPIELELRSAENRMAEIIVRDSGLGIPEEKLPHVFERFERAVSHLNISGLGLGLYIVRQIVEDHGGFVTCESKLGEGSTFRVLLPLGLGK